MSGLIYGEVIQGYRPHCGIANCDYKETCEHVWNYPLCVPALSLHADSYS